VNLWISDLVLTAASFFLAYSLRSSGVIEQVLQPFLRLERHTLMPVRIYLWHLAVILPTWAFLLPMFRVYSEATLPYITQVKRLSKAIGFSGLVLAAAVSFVGPDATNRLIVAFTLTINFVLLLGYRLVLLKSIKHRALDVRNVAVIGSGEAAHEFARTIENHNIWGLKLVGIFERNDVRHLL
jgi:FlaA1/EpsC-like NDP-sugar epimerase